MKYLQTISEHQRTIGFRYSEPKERYKITSNFSGELGKKDIEDILKYYNVKHENIQIETYDEVIEVQGEMIQLTGFISFDILIYTDKEIPSIMDSISKSLFEEWDVELFNVRIKTTQQIRKS